MSGFSAELVPASPYDFTGIPSVAGGKCKGKGLLHEPTHGELEAYRKELRALYKKSLKNMPENVQPTSLADVRDLLEQDVEDTFFEDLYEITATLCNGSPSREELDELPARQREVFCLWVQKEFDPNSYSAGIQGSAQQQNGLTMPSAVS